MKVYVEKNTEQNGWWVRLDDWRVRFNTAAEAESFVERLTARLDAPHSRDMLAGGSPLADAANTSLPAALRCVQEA
ncbi:MULTISPECIES: hypothetical protein [unclassified Pseudomonas]|uniref:hypothetical protein n=1 Tax=unclassified Pseudomonas TaxID=196821 RepID=UPI000A1D9570|nr:MULTISPECIES: hypothetical protein [unclassified Pseudomonas]